MYNRDILWFKGAHTRPRCGNSGRTGGQEERRRDKHTLLGIEIERGSGNHIAQATRAGYNTDPDSLHPNTRHGGSHGKSLTGREDQYVNC
jgi:hypothetical protein